MFDAEQKAQQIRGAQVQLLLEMMRSNHSKLQLGLKIGFRACEQLPTDLNQALERMAVKFQETARKTQTDVHCVVVNMKANIGQQLASLQQSLDEQVLENILEQYFDLLVYCVENEVGVDQKFVASLLQQIFQLYQPPSLPPSIGSFEEYKQCC